MEEIDHKLHSEKRKRLHISFNITWKDSLSLGFQSVLQYSQIGLFIGPITVTVWKSY